MNNIRETDPLRSENWAGVYADVPEEVDIGVRLAFARIRRREMRKKQIMRISAVAACALIAVGVCLTTIGGSKTAPVPDNVASPVAESTVISADDTVYAANDDEFFHVHAACPHVKENAVELPLVTALEFEKEICKTCGANVKIAE